MALVAVQASQVVMQGSYVWVREPEQIPPVMRTWRVSGQVGSASLGSACWFTGFATAPVALVRAVGQVEVLFTLMFGRFYLEGTVETRGKLGPACCGDRRCAGADRWPVTKILRAKITKSFKQLKMCAVRPDKLAHMRPGRAASAMWGRGVSTDERLESGRVRTQRRIFAYEKELKSAIRKQPNPRRARTG